MAAWRRWSRASRAPSPLRSKPPPLGHPKVPPTRARTRGPREQARRRPRPLAQRQRGGHAIGRPRGVRERHLASARVRAGTADRDGAAGARGRSAGARARRHRGDVRGGHRQDLLEVRCVGHAAAAGLPGAARPIRDGERGQTISPSSTSSSLPTGRWSTCGCARRRAMSMNSCWSAPPKRGGSSPRRSMGGQSASGIAWRLHRWIESPCW